MKISKERQSVLAIVGGIVVATLLTHKYYLLIAAIFVAGCYPFPALYVPVHRVWTKIADMLGWITSNILLTIIFFLFLTPIALLKKLFSKDLKQSGTYFSERNKTFGPKDLEAPW
jgi:hypothetical protein